jgi:hypothetical protein
MIPSLSNTHDFLSKSLFRNNSWTSVFSMNNFYIILICFLVLPALTSPIVIDAQILSGQSRNNNTTSSQSGDGLLSLLQGLSGQSRNNSTTSSQSGDGLLSILQDPSILRANLNSSVERVVDVIEERIDTRLQGIKDRVDEIAEVAIPVMIAAVAGIVFLAALIIAFIILYWFEKLRQGRKHKRNLVHLSEHILQELKENIRLLEKSDFSSIGNENKSSAINTNDGTLTQKEVSNSALKVAASSSLFWDLPSNAQYIMLMLETAIDGFNKGFQRVYELTESITLNKIDQQTAAKALKRYDTDLSYYKQYIIDLSNQLRNILEARTRQGVLKTKSI